MRLVRCLFLLASLASPLRAQNASQAPVPLTPDTSVHVGKLPNGLRYWIRHNSLPEKRLELRLVVHAGSILEDDDQKGLAHFVEHMAFNGTTRFAKNDLVKYLESIGVQFGADLNASTSFDETTYILPVPSDKPELVERAFDILQDWAMGVRFDSMEVVNERGVVLGEWRSGLGAGSRVRDKEFPVLFQGSRYAVRLPIGDTAIIGHANPAAIRRFYRDWYRPDLMAVVAVGDYPVDQLEALIKNRFGGLTAPVSPRPRGDAAVPSSPGTRVSIVTDPELTTESVELVIRRPSYGYQTEADERRAIIHGLYSDIAGQRLEEVGRRPDAPFTYGYFGPSGLVRDIKVFEVVAGAKDEQVAAAFEAILRELRRFDRNGVLPTELERAKIDLLRSREESAKEQGKTRSAVFVNEYLSAFLLGTVPTSAESDFAMAQRILPTITLDEVNNAIKDASRGTDRFIAVRAPAKPGLKLPSRATLEAILARTDTVTLTPWTETTVAGQALVTNPPAGGSIVSESTDRALGLTEWRLSNGVRVLIKPTDFKADEIRMSATSSGGLSLLPDDAAFQGEFATAVVEQSGYGAYDPPSLQRRLAGMVVNVSPDIGETEEGFSGSTAPKDLATFFEVLWLAATSPRLDTAAVSAFMGQVRPQLANRDRSPFTALLDTITLTLGRNSPREQPLTLARFETLDPARAFSIYRERFADFSDFTFLFVGNVSLDSLRPLAARWLGGLPASGRSEPWRDTSPPDLNGTVTKIVRKGKEPVSQQLVFFNGPALATGPEARIAAGAAAAILQTRLLDQLREAMGATYGVTVNTSVSAIPRPGYTSTISFTSTPAQADTLWTAAQQIITALQTDGPTADELAKFVAQQRRSTEVSVKTNGFWSSNLIQRVRTGEPMATLLSWGNRLDALTAAAVRDAARMYLDSQRMARFVLLPE